MIAVRDHLDQFGGATVAVVTFADTVRLIAYRAHLAVPFPILSDPDRTLYGAVGAGRGRTRQVWSLGTLRLYARLLRRGRRLRRPTEDVRQLGADIVTDRRGVIVMLVRPATPDARPSVDELVRALR